MQQEAIELMLMTKCIWKWRTSNKPSNWEYKFI